MATKTKKIKRDLGAMAIGELVTESKNLKMEISKIKLERVTGKDRNVKTGAIKRKLLAQILTKLGEKQAYNKG